MARDSTGRRLGKAVFRQLTEYSTPRNAFSAVRIWLLPILYKTIDFSSIAPRVLHPTPTLTACSTRNEGVGVSLPVPPVHPCTNAPAPTPTHIPCDTTIQRLTRGGAHTRLAQHGRIEPFTTGSRLNMGWPPRSLGASNRSPATRISPPPVVSTRRGFYAASGANAFSALSFRALSSPPVEDE